MIKVDIRSENSAYITIGKWVIYIDDSTGEQIIERRRNEKLYRKFYRCWLWIYPGNINTIIHISIFWIISNNYGQYGNRFNFYSCFYY